VTLIAYGLCALRVDSLHAQAQPASLRVQVDAGKELFAVSCANCHGAAGKGAIAPALADRELSPELIRDTILNGRVGTPMPPFKDDLDSRAQAQIVAYVQWVASDGRLPAAVIPEQESVASRSPSSSASPSTAPIAIGTDRGTPARGAELFFDPTRLYSCRICHSDEKKGGPVGPDLSGLDKTPLEVYGMVMQPNLNAPGFLAIALELRQGDRILGIKCGETDEFVQYFDVSTLPPVKRTLLKSEIGKMSELKDFGIFDHTALPFSKQDWLDLSAYLGKVAHPVQH
jgi:mono/diheme cytochrome c family protein